MRVLCVYWGDKYPVEYVYKLRNMVERQTSFQHEFICLSDRDIDGIKCERLTSDYKGWWAKLELFKPGRFPGRNLYFDLDVILTSYIGELFTLGDKLWMRDDFSYSIRNPKQGLSKDQIALLGGDGCCNSSVMVWDGDIAADVWNKFSPQVMNVMHGDQNWISNVMRNRIGFISDKLVCSYKYHVLRGEPITPVVVFHGEPKPHSLSDKDPLKAHWC